MIDQLLNLLAVIAWLWFILFVFLLLMRGYQSGGVQGAVKSFLSWRILLALTIAASSPFLVARRDF